MMYFRHHKQKSNDKRRSNSIKSRRLLKNENLELMLKSSETLLEDYIELEVQFIGRLKCVPNTVDITVKKNLLQQMQVAQTQNALPKVLTIANDSILRLNAFILELLMRDNNEEMIIALPVHNISNVCYTKEADNSHIIAIKTGEPENNDYFEVTLVVVKTKNEAEVICQLFKKCFELLYIERTMSLLDQVIGDDTHSNCSTSVSAVGRQTQKRIPINKKSTVRVKNIDNVKSMILNQSMSLEKEISEPKMEAAAVAVAAKETQSDSKSLNESQALTIEDFIGQLKKELTKGEYENFGMALTEWQKGQLFEKFCMKALLILGKSRIHLIIAMKPFVPKENLEWFKKFVKTNTESEQKNNVYWSSESSLNSNSEAESILSHYFSDVLDKNKEKRTTATTATQM